ncbi:long-chain fatty acid--CoA ligase [Corynebacterium sp. TAE3-ERU12]|uniref:AMP-dependent synthetase/ligase n=1 Tax=Corynebacterium sp. TAE3-ERU12 TaxID=2849491 RepID=UPI001C47420F|nr:long-chain fatty acid--CoA ligase [Corynebacterium sp. TAE3-ERU12]MBV7295683.1 long-chain fatty acid--CoA ligase [Corynebacterium sp. TAE3-ERU12]
MTAVYPVPNKYRTPDDEPLDLAALESAPRTVTGQVAKRVAMTPDWVAFRFPDGGGGWSSRTWADFADELSPVAAALIDLGIQRGDRVSLLSGTRYEWVLADAGIIHAAAATSPLYPTSIPEEIRHIVNNAGSRVIFVEDAQQLARISAIAAELPAISDVIVLDSVIGEQHQNTHWRVRTLDELIELGKKVLKSQPDVVQRRTADITEKDLRSLMYTSGTTGPPKGVRLSHRAMAFEGSSTKALGLIDEGAVHYLWLPLSHAFGQVLLASSIEFGSETIIDGNPDHLVENLAKFKPELLASVPRALEKVYAGVSSAMESAGGVKAKLYRWAIGVGYQRLEHRIAGTTPPVRLRIAHAVADRLVFTKIRDRLGGQLRVVLSGAAPLGEKISLWFAAIGVLVLEGWGMTECGAAATVNRKGAWRAGSVGWPFPGTEVSIAGDGEILLRGPHVMDGYHGLPEATAETIDSDGWLHTGDIGEIDERGFVRVTDRKKQLFKTSTGKYVAPGRIEASLGATCPYIAQTIVGGNGEKFVSALITLDEAAIREWAAKNGVSGDTMAHFAASDEVRELIGGYVNEVNETLSPWERVGRFTIIDREFSIEAGELTPTLKLRRRTVLENFGHLLDAHYQ